MWTDACRLTCKLSGLPFPAERETMGRRDDKEGDRGRESGKEGGKMERCRKDEE